MAGADAAANEPLPDVVDVAAALIFAGRWDEDPVAVLAQIAADREQDGP